MTTALDQVDLIKHLVFPNKDLTDASRAYELTLMRHVIPLDYWGITTGPTAGTSVAVKNGWVPIVSDNWQINSIGYVTGDDRSYVIALLTNENPGVHSRPKRHCLRCCQEIPSEPALGADVASF
jgi:hypothetical protein